MLGIKKLLDMEKPCFLPSSPEEVGTEQQIINTDLTWQLFVFKMKTVFTWQLDLFKHSISPSAYTSKSCFMKNERLWANITAFSSLLCFLIMMINSCYFGCLLKFQQKKIFISADWLIPKGIVQLLRIYAYSLLAQSTKIKQRRYKADSDLQ